ncbi:MAG: nucleotidyltransferase family protein [Thermodesulfovibrionales bacterium]|nr:nucleotidyltransferase family protein [Thermodesulfovibrionales bacterium]
MDTIEILKEHKSEIQNRFPVKTLGVFGSAARGEMTKSSDVDVLVEFEKSVGFFEFLDLEEYLSRLLHRKVDLVTPDALKPFLKEKILKQVVYVG